MNFKNIIVELIYDSWESIAVLCLRPWTLLNFCLYPCKFLVVLSGVSHVFICVDSSPKFILCV